MKHLYLLLFAVALLPFAANAQFSEDFQGVDTSNGGIGDLPAGWTAYDLDGLTPNSQLPPFDKAWKVINFQGFNGDKIAWSTSFYTPSGQANDWMVTPQITVPATGPFLMFEVIAYNSQSADDYEVLISTTGNTPADFTDAPVYTDANPPGNLTPVAIDLSAYAGQQIWIAFRNVANNELMLGINNVEVLSLPQNDVAAMDLDLAHYFAINTNNTLEVTIKNMGSNMVNTVDVEWTDGSNTYLYSATGLNLNPYTTTTITHDVPVTYTNLVEKTITVTVSNINGTADADPTNNEIVQEVSVASQSVARIPLYEQFTSSTCNPCAYFNTNFFNQSFLTANEGDFVLVKYQMNWPGAGDPYYTAEGGVRRAYYQITAAPTLLLDTEVSTFTNTAALQNALDDALTKPAFFDISADYTVTGNSIEVNTTATPYLNGNYVMRIAVIENETVQNTGGNGETSFENVMMKMLPDAGGTVLNCTAGTPISNSFTVDLSTTNVEEMNDLSVVVFVQNDNNKIIMQSTYATNTLSVNDNTLAEVTIYPNPSKGILKIATPRAVDVQINNILGKTVFEQNQVTSETALNVNNLNAGVYFVTISNGSRNQTQKIIIQ